MESQKIVYNDSFMAESISGPNHNFVLSSMQAESEVKKSSSPETDYYLNKITKIVGFQQDIPEHPERNGNQGLRLNKDTIMNGKMKKSINF